jgi:6-phosphofructokinase 1
MAEGRSIKTVGLLSSGGDAPGMNPCIRAVVRAGLARGMQLIGIEDGFEGLIHGRFHPMGPRDVGGILQRGGTILQTARCKDFMEPKYQMEAIRAIHDAAIDGLVVIGGDGSLQGAQKLVERGIAVVGVPASIDNDIFGTDMCIGVDTALNTIVDAIDKLRDTASSHNRAFLVETMGRESGYLAMQAGIVTGAELVLVPEVETDVELVGQVMEAAYRRGKSHCIVVVAEGAKPPINELAEMINSMEMGFSTRVTILGHIQRGGKPSAFDRLLASRFGTKAVEYLVEGKTGVMTGLVGSTVEAVPFSHVFSQRKSLPMDQYEMAKILAR